MKITLLVIEDNQPDFLQLSDQLEKMELRLEKVFHVPSLKEAVKVSESVSKLSLVITDLNLPDSFGFQTFNRVQAIFPHLPVVILTKPDNKYQALNFIQKGAQDYIEKGDYTPVQLEKVIQCSIERHKKQIDPEAVVNPYKILFDESPQPRWIYDLDTLQFLDVNKAAIKAYGYSKEEFLNMTIQDVRPEKDKDKIQKLAKKHLKGKNIRHHGTWMHITKSGKKKEVEITSHNISHPQHRAAIVSAIDISAKRAIQEEQRQMKNYAAAIFENTSDMMILFNKNGDIEAINHQVTDTLHYTQADLKGQRLSVLLPETLFEEFGKIWKEFEETGYHQGIIQLQDANGERIIGRYHTEKNILEDLHLLVITEYSEKLVEEQRQQLLSNIYQTIAVHTEYWETLKTIVSLILEEIGWDVGEIWMYEPHDGKLYLEGLNKRSSSVRLEYDQRRQVAINPDQIGVPAAEVFKEQRTKWSYTGQKDKIVTKTYSLYSENGLTSVAVPIINSSKSSRPIGVLCFYARGHQQEHPYLHQLLSTVADMLSFEIDNLRIAEEYNKLFQYSDHLISVMGFDGYFNRLNPAWTRKFHFSEEELLRTHIKHLIHPEDYEDMLNVLARLANGDSIKDFEIRFVCKKGKIYWLNWTAYPDVSRRKIYIIARDITKVKNYQSELLKTNQRYEKLLREGSDFISVVNKEGHYTSIVQSSAKRIGYKTEDLIGQSILGAVHSADKIRLKNAFQKLIDEDLERIQPAAFRLRNAVGDWLWMEVTATNMLKDENIGGIVINARDVSTRISYQKEMEKLYGDLKRILKSSMDIICVIDRDGKFRIVSDSAKQILGYSPEEMKNMRFWELIHPEDLGKTRREAGKVYKGRGSKNFENRYIHKDGHSVPLIWSSNLDTQNGLVYSVIRDATELKAHENELNKIYEDLRESNDRFEYAMEATSEAIWDWRADTDELYWSKGYERLFGYSKSETSQYFSVCKDNIHDADIENVLESLEKAMNDEQQKYWQYQYRYRRKSGEFSIVFDQAYIIRDENGEAFRVIGAMQDITDKQRAQEEIEHRNDRLKEIAWFQSHVLRAPLARLMGLIGILEDDEFKDPEKTQTYFDHIMSSAHELDSIIRNIVDLANSIEE
jgi:PAS domain S-box-containing protein